MNILDRFLLILLLTSFGLSLSAQTVETDSIIQSLQNLPEDTSKVRKINEFLWEMKFSGMQERLADLGKENIKRAKKLSDLEGAGTASKNIGTVFYYGGDYGTAIEYYKKSLDFYTEAEFTRGIADANRNLGNVYSQMGDWKQSLDYLFESLTAYEQIDYKIGVAGTLDAIGIVYKESAESNNIDKAVEYFHKAVEVKKAINDESGLMASYFLIGSSFFSQVQDLSADTAAVIDKYGSDEFINSINDSALYYLKKARQLNEKYNNPRMHGMISDGIGQVFMNKEQYDSAYIYLTSGLEGKKLAGNPFGIASTQIYLARYFSLLGQTDSALWYLNDALIIAKNIRADKIESDISKDLGDAYMLQKDYEKSAKFYKRFIELNDSLQSEENTRRMTQLEMQYEFDKKEKLREAEAQKQRVILYFFIAGFLLMVLMAVIIFRSYRVKQKANQLLEEKNFEISQKNVMLNQQNEEIEAQRDEIESQRDFVIQQRDKIAEQNKNITDSIVYAQRIQEAVLPPASYIGNLLPEYFILFKPRDIVSGDFYWAGKKDHKVVITASDCTGHGVPGAFMSLLGVSFLNEIVNGSDSEELKSHVILNKLRAKIKESLRQTGGIKESKDGMDMALLVIDTQTNTMEFSGANNPLLRVRDNEITKFKADRMPVGVHFRDEKSFNSTTLEINKDDAYYIYSDGYVDQFGGPKGRKFMLPRFKELILDNHKKDMGKQRQIFDDTIESWKSHKRNGGTEPYEQIDDILVIGIRF